MNKIYNKNTIPHRLLLSKLMFTIFCLISVNLLNLPIHRFLTMAKCYIHCIFYFLGYSGSTSGPEQYATSNIPHYESQTYPFTTNLSFNQNEPGNDE